MGLSIIKNTGEGQYAKSILVHYVEKMEKVLSAF